MGLISALSMSSERFEDYLLPVGFEHRHIKWVFDVDLSGGSVSRNSLPYKKSEMSRPAPKAPGDRTSRKSSPTLLVDEASYVFGIENPDKKDKDASAKDHSSCLHLHKLASRYLRKPEIWQALELLKSSAKLVDISAKDSVAFRLDGDQWLFDLPEFQRFWAKYLEKRLGVYKAHCALCGIEKPILRISAVNVRLFGQKVPILSINTKEQPAFGSDGKNQLANAPTCFSCLAMANQVLQYLLRLEVDNKGASKPSGRHAVVLARDSSPKRNRPLENQIAVFWTREPVDLQLRRSDGAEVAKRSFEDLAKAPIEELDDIPEDVAPVKAGQLRAMLEAPFSGKQQTTELPANRFYLGILSPNKSRLVVREWLEADIEPARDNIKRYMDALRIVHPDGRAAWSAPLPALLEGLQSYTSTRKKNDEKPRVRIGPDTTRKLVRCIYTGASPPEALLAQAVRSFRVPDPPTDDRGQRERQMLRRMSMAAAMKLVLTYDQSRKEQQAMEQSITEHDTESRYKQQAPYNCGRLLAVLEAAQRRASSSGKGVNTTLVDRYYGSASTAPASVFGSLISMATKAHLPKLRREGKEFLRTRSREEGVTISALMEEACEAIDQAGGFPQPLTVEEQAQFALGFYHWRAELTPPPQRKPSGGAKSKADAINNEPAQGEISEGDKS